MKYSGEQNRESRNNYIYIYDHLIFNQDASKSNGEGHSL